MKVGMTKREQKEIEAKCEDAIAAIDSIIEHLTEKLETVQEWIDERTEAWHESERANEFDGWISDLEYKIDELEVIKDEISFEMMDAVL